MVLRKTGTKLLMIVLICMAIKDSRLRLNAKPHLLNIYTVQLRGQVFGRPSTPVVPCQRSLRPFPS